METAWEAGKELNNLEMQLWLPREILNFDFLKTFVTQYNFAWSFLTPFLLLEEGMWENQVLSKDISLSEVHLWESLRKHWVPSLRPSAFFTKEKKREPCLEFGVFVCQNYEEKGCRERDQTTLTFLPSFSAALPSASPAVFCLHRHCSIALFLGFINAAVWQNFAGGVPKEFDFDSNLQ